MKKFWVVWNPNNRNPMIKHDSHDLARAEAERLAMVTNDMFYVMEVIGVARREIPPVRYDVVES